MPFNAENAKAYQKRLRAARKRAGVCSIDGVGRPTRPGGVCQQCLDHGREVMRDLKRQVIAGYGGHCVCCGISTYEFLSIDHVAGDGADERRRLGKRLNSGSLYRLIIREGFPDRYQLLCYNCNMALGFFGYCPHHPEIKRSIAKKVA